MHRALLHINVLFVLPCLAIKPPTQPVIRYDRAALLALRANQHTPPNIAPGILNVIGRFGTIRPNRK